MYVCMYSIQDNKTENNSVSLTFYILVRIIIIQLNVHNKYMQHSKYNNKKTVQFIKLMPLTASCSKQSSNHIINKLMNQSNHDNCNRRFEQLLLNFSCYRGLTQDSYFLSATDSQCSVHTPMVLHNLFYFQEFLYCFINTDQSKFNGIQTMKTFTIVSLTCFYQTSYNYYCFENKIIL